jgi:ATP/maltotriose-dependent transcriptional regulator MalT
MTLTAIGRPLDALDLLEMAEKRVGNDATLLRAAVSRARAGALLALGDADAAADHVRIGLEAATEHELAYDEVMLLEIADDVAAMQGRDVDAADTERAREIRARLGILALRPA